ncbi:mycobactin polyketide synthase MbtD [Mycobacterium fragae]|uniref:Polyketide synthase n=1 Tax=Mycobacterium fragae TaxID=1260918 RepID=A0A1X1UJL9_9MYCO|nr:mycobactin polyketide synthase MbtD [Mycobacterium fragae]MCV7401229.1 mycobactin polyketide synthase MbtD [Mycobacterium fragae]ORV56839.1 polyketide synthase [Mycobacterium fragae]
MGVLALPDGRVPVLISAHAEELIGPDAAAIADYLDRAPDVGPAEVAATLLRLRRRRRHRAVVRAADRHELAAGLRALADGAEHPLITRSSETASPRTAFVFPGQGSQWPSMGAEAYQRLPVYRAEADRCADAFAAAGLPSPLPYLCAASDQEWPQIHIQGAQFTHSVSLAQVWRSCGVLPDITIGHSLGEVAAAYVAGTIALSDAVAVVAARSTVVDRLPGSYGMAMLGIGLHDAQRVIAETAGWLEVSAVNGPSSTVVSGDRDAVAAAVWVVEQRGIFARAIAVDYPGHTSALEPLLDAFEELLPESAFVDAPVEFVSSACGTVVGADTDFADYWCRNLRNSVRFDHAVAMAVQRGANAFIELSANPSLLPALSDLIDESAVVVGSGRRDASLVDQLSANITAAALADPGYRWADLSSGTDQPPLRGFPNAPMRAVHLWAAREPLPSHRSSAITVAFEEWEPSPERTPISAPRRCVAVVAPEDADDAVTRRLTDAVGAHEACEPAPIDKAEIVVVVAPASQHGPRPLRYSAIVGPRCRRVWLVTVRGERVQPGEPVVLASQAALAAMHRSVGFEFPDQTFAHVDLASRDLDVDGALAAVNALLGSHTEVALRENGSGGSGLRPYVRTLRERQIPPAERPLNGAELDNVVITGGTGAIGLRYARHCIERGARRVTLLSRKGLDAMALGRLTDGYRTDVYAPPCDIADAEALSAVAEEHGGDGATLLIHAAGVAKFAPHDQLTDLDLADVFGAKVAGLGRMTEVWPLRPGIRILLCSSVSGLWGGRGHAAYAAANRMLDVMADTLRADGLDCTAVRWGLWQGTGIADADEIARIERSGLVAMDPEAAIDASLHDHRGNPLILAADFDRLRMFFESQGAPMPFAEHKPVPDPAEVAAPCDERPVAEVVRAELAAALSLGGSESVDLSAALVDLGLDSMLALDLRRRLLGRTGASVPLARLLGGITGAELIDALQIRKVGTTA